jgi:type I restriction enzyme S subunit
MNQTAQANGRENLFAHRRLGEVCELLNGLAFKPEEWSSTGIPIIRIQNLNGAQEFNFYEGFISEDYVVQPGTLLFAWSGNRGTSFGPFVWQGPTGVLNQHIFKITPKGGIDANWLHHVLQIARERAEREAHGGSGLVHVRRDDLLSFRIPTPETNEQSRIAAVLDTVDEAIAKTEAVIEKLKQVRVGLLHDLLTRGLDEHGQLRDPIAYPGQFKDSPLGRIPFEWEIASVEDFCSDIVDCPHSTPMYVSEGIPCIRTADMLPGELLIDQAYRVTEDTYRERTMRLTPREGDIVYSREGERLGIASPVGPERVCLAQRVMHLRSSRETDPAYLLWSMNAPAFYRQVVVRIGATTSPHINLGDIRRFVLLKPPSPEQALIGRAFRTHDSLLRAEKTQLAKLRLLKQGLMTDLLTGRVRVPESISVVENKP